MNEGISGFLIDECLSHELADVARQWGYHALAATRMPKLRRLDDYRVAKFALERDLILVTNDMYDLERIYGRLDVHPGIVFLAAGRSKLRALTYQRQMFELVLDEIEKDAPVSEAILVTASEGRGRKVSLNIKRYAYPRLS